jgi:hypothetical protein
MLVRTQVSLPADDHRRAKQRAADLGVSLAEYVRRLVTQDLEESRGGADVTRLFALGASGIADVSENHDSHVAEALEARFPRDRR